MMMHRGMILLILCLQRSTSPALLLLSLGIIRTNKLPQSSQPTTNSCENWSNLRQKLRIRQVAYSHLNGALSNLTTQQGPVKVGFGSSRSDKLNESDEGICLIIQASSSA